MNYFATVVIVILGLLSTTGTLSQDTSGAINQAAKRLEIDVSNQPKNSVYLQTSKNIYVCGEDLWFNAFMLDAQTFTLSALDKTLYVQLQRKQDDSIVWQEMYPINNGLSNGHVYLPQTLKEGDYLLKAYSAHAYSPVLRYFYAVAPIRVVQEPRSIPNHQLKGHQPVIKGAVLFSLFPEGGSLVAGLQNLVAFKASYRNRDPVEVKGTLLKDDKPLLNFTTRHAGLGSFSFTPQKNASYRIRIESDNDSLYTLPEIKNNGIVMHLVKNEKDSLVFKITTSQVTTKRKIFLRLQVRGGIQAVAAANLNDSLEIKIPVQESLQGIAEATLFDEQLRPLAERLVYLHPDQKIMISITQLKEQYQKREKVIFNIKVKNGVGKPVAAVLSLRVYDQSFNDPCNTRDIVNYSYLSTQLRGYIYDPSYYFDSANNNRLEAMDLLLLTQGWRRYTWNEDVLKEDRPFNKPPYLSDSLQARLLTTKKESRHEPVPLMSFNYNKTISRLAVTDSAGRFSLSPENLSVGSRFFIKYFSKKEYSIKVAEPMKDINTMEAARQPDYVFAERNPGPVKSALDTTDLLQYGKTMEEVMVYSKGRGYGDKYLGFLDSIAKFENNTDYVGACGWLNCPACNHGTKPVEGIAYSELIESKKSQVVSHPFQFTASDFKKTPYHYPKYTEEELLKKFQMAVTKGYYNSRQFYEPDYHKENSSFPDNRNTLAWNPSIFTDENGEATVHFFCSDIRGRFTGMIEGVSLEGVTMAKLNFSVTQ
jgi:hypothetical protein